MPRLLPLVLVTILFVLRASASTELRPVTERISLTGRHTSYLLYRDGLQVIGEGFVESRRGDGTIERSTTLDEATSTSEAMFETGSAHSPRLVLLRQAAGLRMAWRTVVTNRPLEPYAHFIDFRTGELLRVEPLFFSTRARVFDPNPVIRLNDPSLQDGNDAAAAVPSQAYSDVEVETNSGGPLGGAYAQIMELQVPVTTPPDSAQALLFDRSQEEFEEVNAYVHIDRSQRHLQSLGYTGVRQIVAYPIPVDAHAANGTDNSYFIPTSTPGRGALYFGDGGTDDAEDSDLLLHEYAHAIQEWIAPGAFTGLHSSQSRALGEGFSDYWAFSAHYTASLQSGRDPFCIAAWDARCWMDDTSQACGYPAGSDCLRRVDSGKTMLEYQPGESASVEHRNGEIWSSALREIFLQLVAAQGVTAGRRLADRTIVEAHFGTPPGPTFASMARRVLDADRLLNSGLAGGIICSAMARRQILALGDCAQVPRGEETWFSTTTRALPIPDNDPSGTTAAIFVSDDRPVDRLYVAVDIRHPTRGDLQLVLIAPDGTETVLQEPSRDRTANLVATYGLDAIPAQTLAGFRGRRLGGSWGLRVSDVGRLDEGSLISWNLILQFVGDAPATVRPTAAVRQVVPVVAHLPGANGTFFRSDLTLFNRGAAAEVATLILTASARDGRTDFAAIRVSLAAGQSVVLADVVSSALRSTGSGQLEIAADSDDILITTRTYTAAEGGGTFGQAYPAVPVADAIHSGTLRWITHLRSTSQYRSNMGLAEVAGSEGRARFRILDAAGQVLAVEEIDVLPFSHHQVPVTSAGDAVRVEVSVTGLARLVAYGSLVDNRSGDPTFLPAGLPRSSPLYGSAIGSRGAFGTEWRTELGLASPAEGGVVELRFTGPDRTTEALLPVAAGMAIIVDDVAGLLRNDGLGGLGIAPLTPLASVVATLRVVNDRGNGTIGERLDLRSSSEAQSIADGERVSIGVELSATARTNVGLVEAGGNAALVRMTLRDSAGEVMATVDLTVPSFGAVQVPMSLFGVGRISGGVISFRILSGRGRILGYTSTVDNVSGDFVFSPAR